MDNMHDPPQFVVGDYVTHDYVRSRGIVYRVVEVLPTKSWDNKPHYRFRIKPAFGTFGATFHKASRTETSHDLSKVDIVTMARERTRLDNFIKIAAEHYGMEDPQGDTGKSNKTK